MMGLSIFEELEQAADEIMSKLYIPMEMATLCDKTRPCVVTKTATLCDKTRPQTILNLHTNISRV